MKISNSQINALCDAMLAQGGRLAIASLTTERVLKAVESGHPVTGGQKFDSPKRAALEEAVTAATKRFACRLVVEGSKARLIAETVSTKSRKDGTPYVQQSARVDLGDAKPAVAWLHRLRTYIAAIRRDGAKAVSAATRKALVAEFNGLAKVDFEILNVSDKHSEGGMGLAKARGIIGNMGAAESEALASFAEAQQRANGAEEIVIKRAKANAAAPAKPRKGTKKRGKAYSVPAGSVFVPSPSTAERLAAMQTETAPEAVA